MGAYRRRGQPRDGHPGGEEAGRGEQRRGGAPADREGPDPCAGEGGLEVQDVVDVGAAERVDRLVRVAEGDQCAAGSGQGAQQSQLGGVRVLVLVDEDHVVGRGQGRGAFGQQDGAVEQFRVVEGALHVEDVQVLGEERGGRLPVRAADAVGEVGQGPGAQAQFAGAGQDGADLVGEPARGQGGAQVVGPADGADPALALQQGADHDVLLRPGQQPQRVGEQVGVLVGADQAVAVGVEGGGLRSPRAAQAQGGPVAEFDGGLAAEGEDQDAGGVRAGLDPGGGRLDQGGGLPGAGSGQDQQWSGGVVNHRPLRCVQDRGSHPFRPGAHQAVRVRSPRTPLRAVGRRGDHVVCRSWWVFRHCGCCDDCGCLGGLADRVPDRRAGRRFGGDCGGGGEGGGDGRRGHATPPAPAPAVSPGGSRRRLGGSSCRPPYEPSTARPGSACRKLSDVTLVAFARPLPPVPACPAHRQPGLAAGRVAQGVPSAR